MSRSKQTQEGKRSKEGCYRVGSSRWGLVAGRQCVRFKSGWRYVDAEHRTGNSRRKRKSRTLVWRPSMSSTRKTAQYTEYGWPSCQSISVTATAARSRRLRTRRSRLRPRRLRPRRLRHGGCGHGGCGHGGCGGRHGAAATAVAVTAAAVVITTAAAGLDDIWVEYPKGPLARAR